MLEQSERQAIIDREHLKLLPLYYWVSGGFLGAYALFMLAYFMFIGIVLTSVPYEDAGSAPPAEFGWMFVGMGVAAFLFMAVFVAAKLLAGFWIAKRKNRIGVMIAAGLSCLEFPYGTLAGVLTFIVLARPSVIALFESGTRETPPPTEPADEVAPDETGSA